MTKNEFSMLAQRWRIGRVMYSTPFRVVVTKVEEGWSLAKTCQREVRKADRADRFLPNFNALQPEWIRFKTVLGRYWVQFLHCWASMEMSFSIFSRGMFRLYCHVWTWYKIEGDDRLAGPGLKLRQWRTWFCIHECWCGACLLDFLIDYKHRVMH